MAESGRTICREREKCEKFVSFFDSEKKMQSKFIVTEEKGKRRMRDIKQNQSNYSIENGSW